jgi:hypothetical protein
MTILCRFGLDRFAFLREARDHAYKDIRGWTKQSLHVLPKKRAKCNHVVVTSPVRNVLDQNLMTDRRLQPRPIVLRSQLVVALVVVVVVVSLDLMATSTASSWHHQQPTTTTTTPLIVVYRVYLQYPPTN